MPSLLRGTSGQAQRTRTKDAIPFADRVEAWLDPTAPATSIVSGAVVTLGDRSGNGHHFTQAVESRRPTYTAIDADFGGRPSMSFDGVNDELVRALWALTGSAVTVCAVFRTASAAVGVQRLLSTTIGTIANTFSTEINGASLTVAAANPAASYTTRSVSVSTSTVYRAIMPINLASGGAGATPSLYVDGALSGSLGSSSAVAGGPLATWNYGIGSNGAGGLLFGGKIAEVIVYNRVLTDSEILVVDAWLAARYDRPPDFHNLELWLDPASPDTSVVADAVATLGDRSGKGRHFTQATDTKRPAYIRKDPDYGGRPSVSADGVDDFLASMSSFSPGPSGACTAYVVCRPFTTATTTNIIGSDAAARFQITRLTTGVYNRYRSSSGGYRQRLSTVGDVPVRLAAIFDGNTVGELLPAEWINGVKNTGVASTSGVPAAEALPAATYRLFTLSGAAQFLQGTIAAILVYNGMHTDQQVAAIDTWLKQRYR